MTTFLVAQKNPTKEDILELIRISDSALLVLNFEKSLKVAKVALNYSFKIKDDFSIANSYVEIGGNYEELSDFDKALEYYYYALQYAKKAKNFVIQCYVYNSLANIYFFKIKKYKLGIENYNKAIKCGQKLKNPEYIAYSKSSLTWAYFYMKDYKKALAGLADINANRKNFKQTCSLAILEMLNAMGCASQNDNKKANILFLSAIEFAERNNLETDILSIYEEYTKFLLNIKDFEKAYIYQKKQTDFKDKTFKTKLLANTQIIAKDIDLNIYKNEFIRSEINNKLQKAIIKKTSMINYLFGAFLLFLFIFLIFIYKSNIIRRRNNKILIQKNIELEIANIKSVESSNLKSQFISTISHELRTPLYGVIGITNMLLDEKTTPFEQKHLKSLEFSANYLLSLVNDILHISKIEEQEFVLVKQDFNIKEEVNLIINALSFSSENNNNIIKVNIDDKIPNILLGDKTRLNQILVNLLGNALKFTKNGIVVINVHLVSKSDKKCIIDFKISDNGVGIAKEDQNIIYDKFVQVGSNSDYKGTGLGLSIVKKLIELFDSKIELESEIGKGTTFSFAIQFDTKKQSNIDNIVIDYNPKNLPIRVLVVEDNKINQLVTKKIIEKFKASCVLTDNGFQAIELLKNEVFDIILMDINMPEIDGFETSKLIRANGITIPIIALTAYSKTEIIDKVVESGINDVLIKPFEESKLYEIAYKQLCKQNAD